MHWECETKQSAIATGVSVIYTPCIPGTVLCIHPKNPYAQWEKFTCKQWAYISLEVWCWPSPQG